jgi:hypothetical protein
LASRGGSLADGALVSIQHALFTIDHFEVSLWRAYTMYREVEAPTKRVRACMKCSEAVGH